MDDPSAHLYAKQLGEEALLRQVRLGKERFRCCGEERIVDVPLKDPRNLAAHHPECKHYREPELPEIHDGQGRLV